MSECFHDKWSVNQYIEFIVEFYNIIYFIISILKENYCIWRIYFFKKISVLKDVFHYQLVKTNIEKCFEQEEPINTQTRGKEQIKGEAIGLFIYRCDAW